jgi:hypothetical protein
MELREAKIIESKDTLERMNVPQRFDFLQFKDVEVRGEQPRTLDLITTGPCKSRLNLFLTHPHQLSRDTILSNFSPTNNRPDGV